MSAPDISFVNLGLEIQHLVNSITIFGFEVKFYGIIIGLGILAGIFMAVLMAKKEGQNPDDYFDFALYAIIFSIIGARIYYVVFYWDNYKDDIWQVFNIRGGGLAIYGGIIAAVITLIVFTRLKRLSFFKMADCSVVGLITGQIIGRWGNFFNCEAFGGYTDNVLAMQIKRSLVSRNMISPDLDAYLAENPIIRNGVEYIQVHPTFLYESIWNICVLIFMILCRKHKKFDGEIMWIYFLGYGIGRFWIEGLRTDQLMLFHTSVAVSQALSAVLVVVSAIVIFFGRKRAKEIVE